MKVAKTMTRIQLILGGGLCAGLLLCSCGDSQDTPSHYDRTLGDTKEGAPLAQGVSDPGILEDQIIYQPAKVQGGLGVGAAADAGGERAVTGGDTDAQIREVVAFFINQIRDGDPGQALRVFNPEHVAALTEDNLDAIYGTLETLYESLVPKLEDQLGGPQTEKLLGILGGDPESNLTWEIHDADNATVSPNPSTILFGSLQTAPTMVLTRQAGEWKFQLEAPLTAEDVEAIVAYHENLREQLNKIIDWIYDAGTVDRAVLEEAVSQALQGQPVELPEVAAPEEAEPEAETAEPAAGEEEPEEPEEGGEEPDEPEETP